MNITDVTECGHINFIACRGEYYKYTSPEVQTPLSCAIPNEVVDTA